MNIRATLKALEIQAPSSNPIPTFPFRSAKPNVSNRPVTVTIPAPSTTPRIPSSGLWDRSIGNVAAPGDGAAGGRFAGNGMDVALMSLLLVLLLLRSHRYYSRETRSQLRSERRVIESDLDRHSLHDLGEIASCVIGGQQREL